MDCPVVDGRGLHCLVRKIQFEGSTFVANSLNVYLDMKADDALPTSPAQFF